MLQEEGLDDQQNLDQVEDSAPWYADRNIGPHPFKLVQRISSNASNPPTFRSVAFFPWTVDDHYALWNGNLCSDQALHDWRQVIEEFGDAVAVTSDNTVLIFFTHKRKRPISLRLPPEPDPANPKFILLPSDKICVAWVISYTSLQQPLLVFSHGSLLYIYNPVLKGVTSYLRGHGGAITSIAVHPNTPHLFCTTSRDFSTRIYDLRYTPIQHVPNPPWPPLSRPSLAGPAHGLHITEQSGEGVGVGRCIAVLMGGKSGGHQAAVLGAAFHPHLPLIATCGMDRTVKIWISRNNNPDDIKREDKPLFSSARIHKARVLSITWLQPDLLMTHSAPAVLRKSTESNANRRDLYLEAGEVVVWRWLGLDRFFPAPMQDIEQEVVRGCASDYQESSSFKIVSITAFPLPKSQLIVQMLHVFHSPGHDPLALYFLPGGSSFSMVNVAHLPVPPPPPFPFDLKTAGKADGSIGVRNDRDDDNNVDEEGNESNEDDDDDEGKKTGMVLSGLDMPLQGVHPPKQIGGWKVVVPVEDDARLENCMMGRSGRVIVGVGSKGSVWVWEMKNVM